MRENPLRNGESMNKIKVSSIVMCSLILTGCVTAPKPSDRYFQIKHFVSGVVSYQVALPSSEACNVMLRSIDYNLKTKGMKAHYVCSSTSASATLPFRATVRNKVYSFTFDVEAINLRWCNLAFEGWNDEVKENLEVVSPCAER